MSGEFPSRATVLGAVSCWSASAALSRASNAQPPIVAAIDAVVITVFKAAFELFLRLLFWLFMVCRFPAENTPRAHGPQANEQIVVIYSLARYTCAIG